MNSKGVHTICRVPTAYDHFYLVYHFVTEAEHVHHNED